MWCFLFIHVCNSLTKQQVLTTVRFHEMQLKCLFKLFSRSKTTPHTLITEDAMIDTTKYGTVGVHYSGNW